MSAAVQPPPMWPSSRFRITHLPTAYSNGWPGASADMDDPSEETFVGRLLLLLTRVIKASQPVTKVVGPAERCCSRSKEWTEKKTTTEIHSTQRNRRKILMKCFSFRTRYGWRDGCIIKENKIIVKYKLMTLWVMLLIFPKKRSRLNKTRFPENRARGKCGMNERQAWVGWKFLMDFSAIIFIWF